MRLYSFLIFLICWSGMGVSLYSETPGNFRSVKQSAGTYAITASADITPGIALPVFEKDQLPGQQKFYKSNDLKQAHAPGRDRQLGDAVLPQLWFRQIISISSYPRLFVAVSSDVHSLIRLLLYPKHSFW